MALNPYESYLGDANPREVIGSTPARLKNLLEVLGTEGADREPAPGKWTARHILAHLADCEVVFAFRLRQALAEDDHVIQPFDQDRWAAMYHVFDAASALDVFTMVRKWNLALIDGVPADAWTRTVTHPERGKMTFQVVVETMAGHDLNHVAQIEKIAAQGQTAGATK